MSPGMADNKQGDQAPTFLKSNFPFFLPKIDALEYLDDELEVYVSALVERSAQNKDGDGPEGNFAAGNISEDTDQDTAPLFREKHQGRGKRARQDELQAQTSKKARLSKEPREAPAPDLAPENKMLTRKGDVAFSSTSNPLVDLFNDLEDGTDGKRLGQLLEAAWKNDAQVTLRMIFHARSIHLGKGNRITAYRAFGWLAEQHPQTLLLNLQWLFHRIIEKADKETDGQASPDKDDKEKSVNDDFEIVDPEPHLREIASSESKHKSHVVRNGLAHGYWKDLLNILQLAVNDELKVDGNPSSVLNIHVPKDSGSRGLGKLEAQIVRAANHIVKAANKRDRHERVVFKIENDPTYRALHLTVARHFARRLKADKALLESGQEKSLSLAAKWAPSLGGAHDKQTCIATSIAEMLFPREQSFGKLPEGDRELYLKHARNSFRQQYLSPLRKALEVVERDVAAKTFGNIKYDRVPSLAMSRYQSLFAEKDPSRFEEYIDAVSSDEKHISGATLLPSHLIRDVRDTEDSDNLKISKKFKSPSATRDAALAQAAKNRELRNRVADGQWKTLVQRIKDSGTLDCSTVAICDVSGSMNLPVFPDGTTPLDSAIGLSLLLTEVTGSPGFITFSASASFPPTSGARTLAEKVNQIKEADKGEKTDFEGIFSRSILPLAVKHKLSKEDMIRRIFVFSDMQFDAASADAKRWTSSLERIKPLFAEAGYEVPTFVFWNLAGGRYEAKPVKADEPGTVLVSGYNPGLMKMFLDGGGFEEGGEEFEFEESGEDQGANEDEEAAVEDGEAAVEDEEDAGEEEKGAGEDEEAAGVGEEVADKDGADEYGADEEAAGKEAAGREAAAEDEDVAVEVRIQEANVDPLTMVHNAVSHHAFSVLKVID